MRDLMIPNGFFGDFFNDFFPTEKMSSMFPSMDRNPLDMKETETEYIVSVNVPGIKKEEIDVTINNNFLQIKSEHKEETKEEKYEKFVIKERKISNSVFRTVRLPENVDTNNITAKMEDGVLHITIPKIEPKVEENKIQIQ